MTSPHWRPTSVTVDAAAIEHNVCALIACAQTKLACAVVKADGYGHGAVTTARAALRGGADWLAVALVEEATALRDAGIDAPILLLSEPPPGSEDTVVARSIMATVYSRQAIDALADAAARRSTTAEVHLKIDTGMHRVGAAPEDVMALAQRVVAAASLRLGGLCTHFAIADVPDDPYTARQMALFDVAIAGLRAAGIDPGVVHAANSAGALFHPAARYDLVRLGIAMYGHSPDAGVDAADVGVALRPALRWTSSVAHVKTLPAGERLSYGLRYQLARRSVIATVPVGYADGVARRWSSVGGAVLVNGRRLPVAGRVTMDQLLVDCGPPPDDGGPPSPRRGDEVVLIGSQGEETITAWEWATKLDTIAYEITCAIGARVPRVVVGASHG